MNDEIRKLFDAPWTVYGEPDDYSFVIQNASEDEIATVFMTDEAKRLILLPELYDALMETVYYKCFECMGGLRHNIDMTREELVKNGCPKQNKSNVCIYVKHIDLLRKVRDVEE